MKTDYMTSAAALPPHLAYPHFLLGMDLKLITKVVYAVLLDAVTRSHTMDKHGRLTSHITPDHIYVKLPSGEGMK